MKKHQRPLVGKAFSDEVVGKGKVFLITKRAPPADCYSYRKYWPAKTTC